MAIGQLLDGGGRVDHFTKITKVVGVDEGGFGGTTSAAAAAALETIRVSEVDSNNGVAMIDGTTKRLPFRYFESLGFQSSVSLLGPQKLVKGTKAEFFITNYDISLQNNITVNPSTISLVQEQSKFTLDVPLSLSQTSATITVNNKVYEIPVVSTEVLKPEILVPKNKDTVNAYSFIGRSSRLRTQSTRKTNMVVVPENSHLVIPIDQNAYGIMVEGQSGTTSHADFFVGHRKYRLGESKSMLQVEIADERYFVVDVPAGASLSYGFLVADETQTVTRWQFSLLPDFSSILKTVTLSGDMMIEADIGGDLPVETTVYLRVSHSVGSAVSEWSDPVMLSLSNELNYLYDPGKVVTATNIQGCTDFGTSMSTALVEGSTYLIATGSPKSEIKGAEGVGAVHLVSFDSYSANSVHRGFVFPPSDTGLSSRYGAAVKLYGDYLFVTDPTKGRIYRYVRDEEDRYNFIHVDTIVGQTATGSFGCAIDAYGDRLFVGDNLSDITGRVAIYKEVDGEYVFEKEIFPTSEIRGFGTALCIANRGQQLIVSSGCHLGAAATSSGKCQGYVLNNGNYVLTYEITSFGSNISNVVNNAVGRAICYNETRDSLFVSAPNGNSPSNSRYGALVELTKNLSGHYVVFGTRSYSRAVYTTDTFGLSMSTTSNGDMLLVGNIDQVPGKIDLYSPFSIWHLPRNNW